MLFFSSYRCYWQLFWRNGAVLWILIKTHTHTQPHTLHTSISSDDEELHTQSRHTRRTHSKHTAMGSVLRLVAVIVTTAEKKQTAAKIHHTVVAAAAAAVMTTTTQRSTGVFVVGDVLFRVASLLLSAGLLCIWMLALRRLHVDFHFEFVCFFYKLYY